MAKKAAQTISKRDFCAHVWQFVHYVEDFMTSKIDYHKPTCKMKCEQVKKLLSQLEHEC